MIQDIQKSTYIDANEETTKALTYDILYGIYKKLEELTSSYHSHLSMCDKRFKGLEDNKKKDTINSSMFGFLGGFVAVAATWLKDKL